MKQKQKIKRLKKLNRTNDHVINQKKRSKEQDY